MVEYEDREIETEELEPIDMTPREFTGFGIRLKGNPIDLSRRPWLDDIYDLPVIQRRAAPNDFGIEWEYRRKILLMFGRQSEKSTTLGNLLLSLANLIPFSRALYISASDVQMREFSDERLRAVIAVSPVLQRLTGKGTGDTETQNVLTKRWINQAKVMLRSVYRSPDRVRGIASDILAIDEIQDINPDHIPVIREVLFRSELEGGPIFIASGTPKTYDNLIEYTWSRQSTRNEWMTKCASCGEWNMPGIDHLREWGLACINCGREINPVSMQSQWVRHGTEGAEWEGFHLCQPIVLYSYRHRVAMFREMWKTLREKLKSYSRAKFMNEVMGRSYDSGLKPVSELEVRKCCLGDMRFVEEPTTALKQTQTWAGIDWGTGDVSYSILSIWGYDLYGRFRCLYAKRYEGIESDPDHVVADMIRICRKWKVNRIGADWGFGFGLNNKLRKAFGADKVILFFHSQQNAKIKWDKAGAKFTTDRTQVLQDCFALIKRGPVSGGVCFPSWEQFETYAADILSVFSEYNERSRRIMYNHPQGVPDDFLHTYCYALLASQFEHPRRDLHAPGAS